MRRRELILVLAATAAARPFLAYAQQAQKPRRVAVIMAYPRNDPQGQLRAKTFESELEKAGWTAGQNLEIDFRWGAGNADWVRSITEAAMREMPDVLVANGDAAVLAAQQSTKTTPVVFIGTGDPVADGLVQSLAHPGGNLTGFPVMEPSLGAKLLGMLKQIAPNVSHVAAVLNPDNATHKHILALLNAAASGFALDIVAASVRTAAEIEAAMTYWGQQTNYGVIVPADPATNAQRKRIIELAEQYRLPTVYAIRAAATDGGLMSYGVDIIELFRQAAIYSSRILKGEKPSELPVQMPTKFELVVNLKTAKAQGLEIPASLLSTADEVIE
jgi:putative tryptophan/tyrosine transport system substrate-binding protein